MDIAPARSDDAPEILALQKMAYESEARLYQDWSLPPLTQTLESLATELAGSIALAARSGSRLVDAVRARDAGGVRHIGRLVVHPECQGRGLGTRLMHAIEDAIPHVRAFELFTGSRSEGNLRLYERLGYRRFREQVISPALTLVHLRKER